MQKANMLKQVEKMQAQMAAAQESLKTMTVTGTAGGDVVTVTMSGDQEVVDVVISDEVIDEGAEMVADLVKAAVNDALQKSKNMAADSMAQMATKMGLPPGLL